MKNSTLLRRLSHASFDSIDNKVPEDWSPHIWSQKERCRDVCQLIDPPNRGGGGYWYKGIRQSSAATQ